MDPRPGHADGQGGCQGGGDGDLGWYAKEQDEDRREDKAAPPSDHGSQQPDGQPDQGEPQVVHLEGRKEKIHSIAGLLGCPEGIITGSTGTSRQK